MSNIEFHISNSEFKLLIRTLEENYKNLEFEIIIIYYIGYGKEIYLRKKGYKYKLFLCKSPKEFYSNPMNDNIFYKEMYNYIFNL